MSDFQYNKFSGIKIIDSFLTPLQTDMFVKESSVILNDRSSRFMFNHVTWNNNIHDNYASGPIMTHPIEGHSLEVINEICENNFNLTPTTSSYQYYFEGGYIPWHDDGRWNLAVTVFLQDYPREYGGMFCYLDKPETENVISPSIKAGRAILQKDVWHHVTPVTRRATVRQSLQLFFK